MDPTTPTPCRALPAMFQAASRRRPPTGQHRTHWRAVLARLAGQALVAHRLRVAG